MAGELGRILFFYSYLIFMYFLMLNMLLAIIVDSYEHMKENIGDHVPTVWSDLADLVRQMYNIRKSKNRKSQTGDAYLSHEQVVHHFDEMLNTDAVNRDIQSHLEREQDETTLNINGFVVDRSNLQRVFAAHILKDERSVTDYRKVMSRDEIVPLVDTLLAHFGKAKRGCSSFEPKPKEDSEKTLKQKLSSRNVKIAPMEEHGKQTEAFDVQLPLDDDSGVI